jgi:hypothetical protein
MPTDLFMPGFADFLRTNIEMECVRQCVSKYKVGYRSKMVKGTMSRDEYFFRKLKHFNLCFLCMCLWFSTSFNSFSVPYAIINFFLLL